MNEKLIHDYWLFTNSNTYPAFDIEIQSLDGGTIVFREVQKHNFCEFNLNVVEVLDVVSWVYSKITEHERANCHLLSGD